MTTEEFYRLAENRSVIKGASIYKLTVREINNNVSSYTRDSKTGDWFYEINRESNWYTTKEKAVKFLRKYIKEAEAHYYKRIHSAVIERIPANIPVENGGQLEWWLYDSAGCEIDHSVCAWELNNDPKFQDAYLGRKQEEIRFDRGDIVEIIHDDKVVLSVLSGLPGSIDEMWNIYQDRFNRESVELDERIMRGEFYDSMADMYYYLRVDGNDLDEVPNDVTAPLFEIPAEAQEELYGRYNRWKTYIDSHICEEINWDELKRIVRG